MAMMALEHVAQTEREVMARILGFECSTVYIIKFGVAGSEIAIAEVQSHVRIQFERGPGGKLIGKNRIVIVGNWFTFNGQIVHRDLSDTDARTQIGGDGTAGRDIPETIDQQTKRADITTATETKSEHVDFVYIILPISDLSFHPSGTEIKTARGPDVETHVV